MRLEYIDVDDTLAAAADQLWPQSTWSAVVDYALDLAIRAAYAEADTEVEPTQAAGLTGDELNNRLAALFGPGAG